MTRRGVCWGLALLMGSVLAGAPARSAAQDVVRVGFIPIANVLPMYAAIDKGFMAEAGIKVELEAMAGGAKMIEAMAGGSLHAGYSNYISLFQARDQGFDIVIVAPNNRENPADPLTEAMVVLDESPVRAPRDLENRTVAVNTLNNVNWLYAVEWVAKAGGDPKKVRFVEIGFPQMFPALRAKQVDAVFNVEPFLTLERAKGGLRLLDNPFTGVDPRLEVAGWFALGSWVKAKPDLVRRFVRALYKGMDYANAHPDEWATIIAKFTRLQPDLIRRMKMVSFAHPLDVTSLQGAADLSLTWGLIKKKLDVRPMLHPGALE